MWTLGFWYSAGTFNAWSPTLKQNCNHGAKVKLKIELFIREIQIKKTRYVTQVRMAPIKIKGTICINGI